jgi:ketosteroid isomerase-like protein
MAKRPTKPPSPEAVARKFVNAINGHDVRELGKLMLDEHRFIDSLGTVVQGRETMRNGWDAYFRMVPDYKVIVEETFSDGPIVVMFGVARGTYARDGQVRLENAWQTPAAWRAQIENEKVAEWRVYADNEPIRQLIAKST